MDASINAFQSNYFDKWSKCKITCVCIPASDGQWSTLYVVLLFISHLYFIQLTNVYPKI